MALVETPTVPIPDIPSATTALLTNEIPTDSSPTKLISVGQILGLVCVFNLTELKQAQTRDKLVVSMGGYYVPGDGGGGVFQYVANSTAPADDGVVVMPDSGIGRWFRTYSGAINVKWYGAKGDGLTDDGPRCAAALLAGNKLYFPLGTYLFGAPTGDFVLYLGSRSGLEFYGDGRGSVLKLANNIGRGKSMFGSGMGDTPSKLYWHDLTIDLNGSNNLQTSFSDPLRLNSFIYCFSPSISDVVIERVSVLNASGSQPIRLSDDTSNLGDRITIRDCVFSNFGIGLTGNQQQDVSVIYVYANNVVIENNVFRCDPFTMSPSRGHTAIELHAGKNSRVRGNSFQNVQMPTLLVSDAADMVNCIVADNEYTDCMYLANFDPSGSNNVENAQIRGNQYISSQPFGVGVIYVGMTNEDARSRRSILIADNNVSVSTSAQGRAFVMLINSMWNDIKISRNKLRNLTAQAIHLEGNSTGTDACLEITENTFESCGSTIAGSPFFPTDGTPVQIVLSPELPVFKSVTIENNRFYNTAAKNYAGLGHIYLGANLRAKVISVRNNVQPDDSYDLVHDAGCVASLRKELVFGNTGPQEQRWSHYAGSSSVIPVAATLTLPNLGTSFYISVTGPQNITSINPTYDGHEITLYFNSGSASKVADGGNLKLSGDFTWATNDTLRLMCLGGNWYELSRSVNG